MAKGTEYYTAHHPKTLILGIDAPYNQTHDIDAYFDEFENLVKSNRVTYDEALYIKLREIEPTTFITKGKLEHLIAFCDEHKIEEVIISEPLTTQQERNLGNALNCPVFDRTHLILEIFEKSAHSAEGKAQVAIAMLQYKKSRLAGRGVYLAQQKGVFGLRSGPGETQKERERRHIDDTILKFKKQLKKIQKSRETQRKSRLTRRVPLMCLIGYTNAGKSSILNALTKGGAPAEDKLFATLDTTTRELFIDKEKKGLISDTVGFIQQLPHQLVEAFKSTLDELHYADLLLHVIDLSDKNWESQIEVVHTILDELDIDKEMLYVFNKSDKIEDLGQRRIAVEFYQPHVVVSSLSKEGLAPLTEFLSTWQPPNKK